MKTSFFQFLVFSLYFFGTNISISSKKGTHKLWQIWIQNANKDRVNFFFYFFHIGSTKASSYWHEKMDCVTDICMIYVWNKCEYVCEGKTFETGVEYGKYVRMWPWQSIGLTRNFLQKELYPRNIFKYLIENF